MYTYRQLTRTERPGHSQFGRLDPEKKLACKGQRVQDGPKLPVQVSRQSPDIAKS